MSRGHLTDPLRDPFYDAETWPVTKLPKAARTCERCKELFWPMKKHPEHPLCWACFKKTPRPRRRARR